MAALATGPCLVLVQLQAVLREALALRDRREAQGRLEAKMSRALAAMAGSGAPARGDDSA